MGSARAQGLLGLGYLPCFLPPTLLRTYLPRTSLRGVLGCISLSSSSDSGSSSGITSTSTNMNMDMELERGHGDQQQHDGLNVDPHDDQYRTKV